MTNGLKLRQVCVQLPTSADNVTLLADHAILLCALMLGARRPPLSIDISFPPGPQQQTRTAAAVDRWDKRSDGHRGIA